MEQETINPTPPILSPSRFYPQWILKGKITWPLFLGIIFFEVISAYLVYYKRLYPVKVGFWFLALVGLNLFLYFCWSGLWSLASKVFKKNSYFWGHLNIALLSSLVSTVLISIIEVASFSLNSNSMGNIGGMAIRSVIGLWGFTGHLWLVSRAPLKRLAYISSGIAVFFVSVAILVVVYLRHENPALLANHKVYPHFLLLASPQKTSDHLEAIGSLKADVDKRAARLRLQDGPVKE